jgi:hypothetical protein
VRRGNRRGTKVNDVNDVDHRLIPKAKLTWGILIDWWPHSLLDWDGVRVHTLGDDEELLQVVLRLSLRLQLDAEAGGSLEHLLSSVAKPEVSRHSHDADVNAKGHGNFGGLGLTPPATEGEAQRALRNRCMQNTHHGFDIPEENEEILKVVGVGDERPLLMTKATREHYVKNWLW